MSKLDDLINEKCRDEEYFNKLEEAKNKEIKEATDKILERHMPMVREANAKLVQSYDELSSYLTKLSDYQVFNLDVVGEAICALLTRVYGEEYIIDIVKHRYIDLQTKKNKDREINTKTLIIKPKKLNINIKHKDVNGLDKLLEILKYHNVMILKPNYDGDTKIEFYEVLGLYGVKTLSVETKDYYNFKRLPIVKEFIDYLLNYAIENKIKAKFIAEKTINSLIDEFLNKENILIRKKTSN